MNAMGDKVKTNYKNIESIKSYIVIKDIEDNIEQLEHNNKSNLKETLNIKRAAHNNNMRFVGSSERLKNTCSNWMLVMGN